MRGEPSRQRATASSTSSACASPCAQRSPPVACWRGVQASRARPSMPRSPSTAGRLLPGRLRVRGRATPASWRLDDVVSVGSRNRESPLVGRERELGALARALSRTRREQTPCLFTVLGPAGVWKSRLANEFVSALGGEATVLRGRCPSYGDGISLGPLAEMIDQLCGGD